MGLPRLAESSEKDKRTTTLVLPLRFSEESSVKLTETAERSSGICILFKEEGLFGDYEVSGWVEAEELGTHHLVSWIEMIFRRWPRAKAEIEEKVRRRDRRKAARELKRNRDNKDRLTVRAEQEERDNGD